MMVKTRAQKKLRRHAGEEPRTKMQVSIVTAPWDHGATGQANRIGLIKEERGEIDPKTGKMDNPTGATGMRRVDMLEVYHRRGVITPCGYAAGELLRAAWLRTQIGQCAPWLRERVDSSPKPDHAISIQITRVSKLVRITRLIPAEDEEIVHTVVALGVGIGNIRGYRGRNHAFGMIHLREALDRLAERIEAGG